MNKIIKEQLGKVKFAKLPPYNDDSKILIILRQSTPLKTSDKEPQVNGYGTIEVEDYILHPYDGFTLHTNWNKGIIPKDKVMKVKFIETIGKMYHVESDTWEGWLPRKSFKVLG